MQRRCCRFLPAVSLVASSQSRVVAGALPSHEIAIVNVNANSSSNPTIAAQTSIDRLRLFRAPTTFVQRSLSGSALRLLS